MAAVHGKGGEVHAPGLPQAGAGHDGREHREGRCANPTSGLSQWLMEANVRAGRGPGSWTSTGDRKCMTSKHTVSDGDMSPVTRGLA